MADGVNSWVNRLRLWSGLILMVYTISHFLNHSVGLISIEVLEAGQAIFVAVWRSWLGTAALYGGVVVHLLIAVRSFVLRDSLRGMTGKEMAQLGLGALLPFLVIEHVVGTRVSYELFGVNDHYRFVLLAHWVFLPYTAAVQVTAILAAWIHGCIGLDYWLSSKAGYERVRPYLLTPAILLPLMALVGWLDAGLAVQTLAKDQGWLTEALVSANATTPGLGEKVYAIRDNSLIGYGVVLLIVIAGRFAWHRLETHSDKILVTYPQGQTVQIAPGSTILEASRAGGVPHASVCGGRGRCSTCRVRVDQGFDDLPVADEDECKVLKRVSAPPKVRLACQLRPVADLQVTPLLMPGVKGAPGPQRGTTAGEEREIAVMFADIRGFTKLAESKLPYDTVFLLNRYFAEMGTAVKEAGGRLDKFIGDGVMALFGIDDGPAAGSRQAIDAARRMSENLARLNQSMKQDLPEPLRIGIGIHTGACIVGEMGYGDAIGITAIGDTVNTASRLEGLSKEHAVQCVISETTMQMAGMHVTSFPVRETEIRGRSEPLKIITIQNARTIPAI